MVRIMTEWIPGSKKERRGVSNRGVSEIAGHVGLTPTAGWRRSGPIGANLSRLNRIVDVVCGGAHGVP